MQVWCFVRFCAREWQQMWESSLVLGCVVELAWNEAEGCTPDVVSQMSFLSCHAHTIRYRHKNCFWLRKAE